MSTGGAEVVCKACVCARVAGKVGVTKAALLYCSCTTEDKALNWFASWDSKSGVLILFSKSSVSGHTRAWTEHPVVLVCTASNQPDYVF